MLKRTFIPAMVKLAVTLYIIDGEDSKESSRILFIFKRPSLNHELN